MTAGRATKAIRASSSGRHRRTGRGRGRGTESGMIKTVDVLCAVRNSSAIQRVREEMDDGETCVFRIVHHGGDALASAQRFVPDILVIDAVLTEMDGLAVVDRLRAILGDRMPRVIGGAMLPMAREGFLRRGASCVVSVPWNVEELDGAMRQVIREIDTQIDWPAAQEERDRASALLRKLGMRECLRGFDYLAWAAALASMSEGRLFALGKRLYQPVAQHEGTTPQNVERLIRHAVETTIDAVGPDGIYGFFGNTLDPTRGKPTNAQMIAMLAQRLRVS